MLKIKINSNRKFLYIQKLFYCITAILLLAINCIHAQETLSLVSAIDSALRNNLTLHNEKLRTEYSKALIPSGTSLPATSFTGELGQINSAYFDNGMGISQTFLFPAVYKAQKQLLTQEWKASVLNVGIKEWEIKKQITRIFVNYGYWKAKEQLLHKSDSLYVLLLSKAVLRLQKGESNRLETTFFEAQKNAIALQLIQTRQELALTEAEFLVLTNTSKPYRPEWPSEVITVLQPHLMPTQDHPELRFAEQLRETAKMATQTEQSKLLPEITLGYNNMSIKGTGANNKTYTGAHRFHAALIGLSVPIFTSAQKSKIKASQINEVYLRNHLELQRQVLNNSIKKASILYVQQRERVELFSKQYLQNAAAIKETALKQFKNGEINYLEYVVLANQAIAIESESIDALNLLQHSIIELNFPNIK